MKKLTDEYAPRIILPDGTARPTKRQFKELRDAADYATQINKCFQRLGLPHRVRAGMLVFVYRSDLGDATKGGATSMASNVLLVGDGVSQHGVFVDHGERPVFEVLTKSNGYTYARPADAPDAAWYMMGGNFVYSSDSRFRQFVNTYPIPVHDRKE